MFAVESGHCKSRFLGAVAGRIAPVIASKRKRCLDGVEHIVLSLTLRGLSTGQIVAHFEEVYGARACKDTICRITER